MSHAAVRPPKKTPPPAARRMSVVLGLRLMIVA
jgi:hypothetical protein